LGRRGTEGSGQGFYWLGKGVGGRPSGGGRNAMGEFYQDGDGVNVDMQKAVHYYQVSAAQRYWRAEFLVGIASELGTGIPRNRAMAIVMLNRAADDGQSGLAQQLVTMLRCWDTPRFANADQMNCAFGEVGATGLRRCVPPASSRQQALPRILFAREQIKRNVHL
jgi:TPR repeat protein